MVAYSYPEVWLKSPEPVIPELVQRAQAGDVRAFERLYREHVERVFAVCYRIVADRSKAEELTQDVFVRVWEVIGSFRGESAFPSWLHRVAVNVVLVELRTEKRYQQRVTTVDDLEPFDKDARLAPPGEALDLETAMARLPRQARAVFVLHDIEGFRHEEIAEQLGLAVGTSKAQLHRARKLLREVLES
jgi:RNA polymerase sigma-70 factor (ECF subfamily)